MPRLGLGSSLTGGVALSPPSFISTWTTTGSDEKITLPFVDDSNSISFTIDWGDGGTDTVTAYNNDLGGGAIDHTYSSAATYTIKLEGIVSGLKFNGDAADRAKIQTITSWGTLNISTSDAFKGCSALDISAADAPTISSTDMNETFYGCDALTTNIGSLWDLSSAEGMSGFFNSCENMNIAQLANWDVSSSTGWTEAFQGCAAFNQDLSAWEMGNVVGTYRMFKGCTILDFNAGGWDMSNNTYMRELFSGCLAFNNGGSDTINNWNVTASSYFRQMFYDCQSFNQPIGDWTIKTSGNIDMYQMLRRCYIFNQDISGWDISNVNNLASFFDQSNAVSTANYNLLLHHWEAEDPVDSLSFDGGDATTDSTTGGVDGTAARARLVLATGSGGHGWTITDGD